ncbi:MAG: hypothetical protein L0J03_13395 [Brevibacterium sp.]|nr:hypothetical protein [Brevibacterium sp.]
MKALTMKKLVLAPAVALAFTGLVAAPVAAAETPSTQSDSALTKAEQLKKDKEEAAKAEADRIAKEEAAQKKAEEEKEKAAKEAAAKNAAAKEAAEKKKKEEAEEKANDAKESEKPAPKDDSKDSKKDDSDAKDDDKSKDSEDSEDSEDEVKTPNASVTVASSVGAEDLAKNGLKVNVTHLEKGDKVAVKGGGLSAESTTATSGSAALTLQTDKPAKDINEGTKSLSIQVTRASETSDAKTQSLNETVEIIPFAAIDSELSVDPEQITPEDLADENKGVQVTVTNLEEGDTVTDDLTDDPKTVDADGDFTFSVYYKGPAEDLEDPVPFTVTIEREGEEPETLSSEINVVDEVVEVDPQVSLATDEISEGDFNKNGLEVTGEGFTPGGTVELHSKPEGAQSTFIHNELTADEDGKISGTVKPPEDGLDPGTYILSATDVDTEEVSNSAEFTIAEDAVDPIDASLTVDPKEITAEDLSNKDKGVTVTVSGVKEGDKITDSLTGDTRTADADGDYKLHLYYQGNPDSLEKGKVPFTVTIDREGTESQTLKGNINVVAEDKEDDGDDGDNGDTPEAPAEASFSVSPKTLEAADFANEKKGVTLAVENCEPGADVHFAVTPKGIQVTAYENTVKADDEGKASVNVFGTSDNASAYVGSYTASAMCGDDSMKESFTVTAGADGGGSDDGNGNNGGNDGSQLPRTGADLGGLASGAMLLLVGGAAIAMTGRRKKVGQSPSDF